MKSRGRAGGSVGTTTGAFGVAFTSADAGPTPAALAARRRKTYSVPLASPSTSWLAVEASLAGIAVQAPQTPLLAVRWPNCQPVIEASPGSLQASATAPSPPVAVNPEGAAGTLAARGVAATDAEAAPAPMLLRARSSKAYSVPFSRFRTSNRTVVAPASGMAIHLPNSPPSVC